MEAVIVGWDVEGGAVEEMESSIEGLPILIPIMIKNCGSHLMGAFGLLLLPFYSLQ